MTIEIDLTQPLISEEGLNAPLFITSEHQYPLPSSGADGVSFPDFPTLRRSAIVGVIALGTITIGDHLASQLPQPPLQIDLVLTDPKDLDAKVDMSERYSAIRKGMTQTGVALLGDEDLRREIDDYKGVRTEQEV